MIEEDPKPTNPRQLRKDTDRQLLYLVIFTLVIVGSGVTALVYGVQSLLTVVPCLLVGAGLIVVPWLVLNFLEYLRNKLD